MKNIILAGFMGTGKTTVGKVLADKLNMSFVDMDDVIEERAGKKISLIFEEDGEPRFREMERELVKELAQKEDLVIGAGGGIVVDSRNVDDFSASCTLVCLVADADTVLERVSAESHRPLLEGDEKAVRIRELLESRRDLYGAIEKRVDTSGLTPDEVADAVLALVSAG